MGKDIRRSDVKQVIAAFKSGELTPRSGVTFGSSADGITARNISGVDFTAGQPLQASGFLFDSDTAEEFFEIHTANGVCMKATSATSGKADLFAAESIPNGTLGRCSSGGVIVPVQLNIVKADHVFARFADGEVKTSLAGPHRIITMPTGTGSKWGYIALGAGWSDAAYSGKLKTALAAGTGSSATVTVTITGTTATEDVTAYGYPDIAVKALAIGKGARIVFDPLAEKWYFDKLDC